MTGAGNAYLILGNDPLLAAAELEKLLEGADPLSIAEFVPSDDLEKMFQSLATPAMFGERRIAVVRGVDELPAEASRQIAAYLDRPDPRGTLVLLASKPPGKIAAAVKRVGRVIEAGKGKRTDVFNWLKQKAQEEGLRISGESMASLIEAVGDERMALAQAIDELALALPRGASVSPKQIHRQFQGRARVTPFAFIDAAATKQVGPALDALHRLLSQSEPPQLLFWNLTRHFRMLLVAGERSSGATAEALAIPLWRAEKLCRQARTFSGDALIEAYQILASADRKMKNSEEPEALTLERAVVAIAQG